VKYKSTIISDRNLKEKYNNNNIYTLNSQKIIKFKEFLFHKFIWYFPSYKNYYVSTIA